MFAAPFIVLAGCMSGGDSQSPEASVAVAFPNEADRSGIYMALPQGRQAPARGFTIGFYPSEVSDNEVRARLQSYCSANGIGTARTVKVRDGGWKIRQDDGSLKDARRGEFRCE